jgi:hypothetical protein
MSKLPNSPLALSSTPSGFTVVDSSDLSLIASNSILAHIGETIDREFDVLNSAAEFIIDHHFLEFKDKPARILSKPLAKRFMESLENYDYLDSKTGDFVTDEERLGYENIYWRLVRKNSLSDVGPIHADRWFWELGENLFPNTHVRVKVWMPLIQDDQNPSLIVLPESHKKDFTYDFKVDSLGKKKPIFHDDAVSEAMVTAPVKVGEAIVFNDSLLHGGKVTDTYRVSLEFTIAKRVT